MATKWITKTIVFFMWFIGMSLIVKYAGWFVACGIFLVMWADNVNAAVRLEDCGIRWWTNDTN